MGDGIIMWIEIFEWMIVSGFLISCVGLILAKKWIILSELFAGSIFGVMLEYLNIAIFQTYTYNTGFFIQVGNAPNNVPIAIGLAWGLIGITTFNISERWGNNEFIHLLMAVMIAVSFDLFLDVVATRLDGGFWVWIGIDLDWNITMDSLYGIPWGNFMGWYFVIFFFGLFRKIFRKTFSQSTWWQNILRMVLIPIASNAALLATLFLLGITRLVYYGAVVFGVLYLLSLGVIITYNIVKKPEIKYAQFSYTVIFWAGVYLYLFVISILEDFWKKIPVFMLICLFLFALTIFVDIFSVKRKNNPN